MIISHERHCKKCQEVISNQMELAQCDIDCILDGLDEEYIVRVCQVVVDRLNMIRNIMEDKNG